MHPTQEVAHNIYCNKRGIQPLRLWKVPYYMVLQDAMLKLSLRALRELFPWSGYP